MPGCRPAGRTGAPALLGAEPVFGGRRDPPRALRSDRRPSGLSLLPRLGVILACLLVLPAWRLGQPVSFFEEEQGIANAVAKISAAAGGLARILSIHAVPNEVHIEAQDPGNTRHVNKWRLVRMNARWFNWDRVGRPEPVQLSSVHSDLEASLFDLSELDLAAAKTLVEEALARAALEEPAAVTAMDIRRQLHLLPRRAAGAVRWSVYVHSPREHARIVADAKGKFVRADLSGTDRARELDILRSPELVAEAAQAFAEGVGLEPVLVSVGISARSVSFRTNLPAPAVIGNIKQRQVLRWNLDGLQHTSGSVDLSRYFGAAPTFAIGDVDWASVVTLPRRAKEALAMPGGTVAGIELQKPGDRPGAPALEWTVSVEDANQEKGTVRFDARGEIVGKTLPESRRPPFDGRDPDGWSDARARLEQAFGRDGSLAEITIGEKHIRITADDPQNPGELAQFLLDQSGIKRFGTASPFAAANPRFALADLDALTAERMRALQEATASRLGLPRGGITTITVGRGSMDPSPEGNVTVEIRAEEAPFKRSGRVNFEIDGREIKAYLP